MIGHCGKVSWEQIVPGRVRIPEADLRPVGLAARRVTWSRTFLRGPEAALALLRGFFPSRSLPNNTMSLLAHG